MRIFLDFVKNIAYLVAISNISYIGKRILNTQELALYSLIKNLSHCCLENEAIQAEKFGLSIPESRVLIAMKMDNCAIATEIAKKLCLAKSRITRIIDGMVEKGLIIRKTFDKDRRIWLVELTEHGETTASQLMVSIAEAQNKVLDAIPADEHSVIYSSLRKLESALNFVRKD